MEPAARRASALSALENVGILRHIFEYVGAGQHFFVSTVSKQWYASYAQLPLIRMHWKSVRWTVSKRQGTLVRAAFASVSRVQLAHKYNLQLDGDWFGMHQTAGIHADVPTLAAAHELGLKLNSAVVWGAASSPRMPTFLWLMNERRCRLPKHMGYTMGRSGCNEKLAWLKEHGHVWDIEVLRGAVETGHKHIVQYLLADGCPINCIACLAAAKMGDLSMLKWLCEQGHTWRSEEEPASDYSVVNAACSSGSIELLQWLRGEGLEIGADALVSAVAGGHLPLCKHLRAEHTGWSEAASTAAAAGKHCATLRWLLDSGCPCGVQRLCCAAAGSGRMDTLTYVAQKFEPGAELLTHMLNAAGSLIDLAAAQWLRARGAEWPAALGYFEQTDEGLDGEPWSELALDWARQQGCDSPLTEIEFDSSEEDDSDDSGDESSDAGMMCDSSVNSSDGSSASRSSSE